ncbi:hypothetical protein JHU04_001615 [Brenneria sp. 4F2]|nr:hypothetical protein [Brenneria bubanii]
MSRLAPLRAALMAGRGEARHQRGLFQPDTLAQSTTIWRAICNALRVSETLSDQMQRQ